MCSEHISSGKIDSLPFFCKGQKVNFVLLLTEAKFSICNLFKLTSYDKFGFSRPDLDGNKLAKGMYLREKPVIEKCLSSNTKASSLLKLSRR